MLEYIVEYINLGGNKHHSGSILHPKIERLPLSTQEQRLRAPCFKP